MTQDGWSWGLPTQTDTNEGWSWGLPVSNVEESVSATPHSVTPTLQYAILISPSTPIQKTLQYSILISPSVELAFGLQYAILISPSTEVTKGLQYEIGFTPSKLEIALDYDIGFTPAKAEKGLQYIVFSETKVEKDGQYLIKFTPSTTQKDGQYSIKFTPSATSLELTYLGNTPTKITKTLDYIIAGQIIHTVVDIGGTQIVTFTTVGSGLWPTPVGVTSVNYLVVAGGGGGGGANFDSPLAGGGGGAGGMRTGTTSVSGNISVVVGAGGVGGSAQGTIGTAFTGTSGSSSSFGTITAYGGGGGAAVGVAGKAGGSGGGACGYHLNTSGGAGTSGQGYAGGSAPGTVDYAGCGGGGAGGVGQSSSSGVGAIGGIGVSSSISGTATTYAIGGAGGFLSEGYTVIPVGMGANTGAGGKGGSFYGGTAGTTGSSGIVIVSYTIPPINRTKWVLILQYSIKTYTDKTFTLSYKVKSKTKLTKGLEYKVLFTTSEITKGLTYDIKPIVRTDLLIPLVHIIKSTPLKQTISLSYLIGIEGTPSEKTLEYSVCIPTLTYLLSQHIVHSEQLIELGLMYMFGKFTNYTFKTNRFNRAGFNKITFNRVNQDSYSRLPKWCQYLIKLEYPTTLQYDLTYLPKVVTPLTKDLEYDIHVLVLYPTDLEIGLEYTIKEHSLTTIIPYLEYNIKNSYPSTLDLKYSISTGQELLSRNRFNRTAFSRTYFNRLIHVPRKEHIEQALQYYIGPLLTKLTKTLNHLISNYTPTYQILTYAIKEEAIPTQTKKEYFLEYRMYEEPLPIGSTKLTLGLLYIVGGQSTTAVCIYLDCTLDKPKQCTLSSELVLPTKSLVCDMLKTVYLYCKFICYR